MNKNIESRLTIVYVPIHEIRPNEYNPKKSSAKEEKDLGESVETFGAVDPLILNSAPARKNILINGEQRLKVYKRLGYKEIPCVYVNIPEIEREKELCIRLSKNVVGFDWRLLANFDEEFLKNVGFESEELDKVFGIDESPEIFDLEKELRKLDITKIETKPGDIYEISRGKDGPDFRLMCGDSTIETDVLKLMNGRFADLCFTDPPYSLEIYKNRRNGKPTEGFGVKRNRTYLETDDVPPDFTERWMANVAKIQKPDFSIIVFENPKNLRLVWNELEKHWKYRNTIIWHLPNRVSGYSAKYKFFNKHDFAITGTGGNVTLNTEPEADELFQNEYENALYATSGKPHWESYEKGKKICPTDFVEFHSDDEKHSGQGVVFGCKPVEILIPYIKVLTKRDDLIIETFGGSGSCAAAALRLGRRCYMMEKSPVYCEVIKRRIERLTGCKTEKIHG